MPMYWTEQRTFLDLQREERVREREGTLAWLLVRFGDVMLPEWLTRGWRRGKGRRGRKAWPVRALLALLLLRWSEEGLSRVGACRRAETDTLWRYAMGLSVEGKTPTEKTLREVESWLQEEHEDTGLTRVEALFEHVVHVALWSASARRKEAPKWVMDSTPMWCFGAVLDTVRLLGDGLRRLGRMWARATRRPLGALAIAWKLPMLLAKSTKGSLRIDWSDASARTKVITDLVEDVLRAVSDVRATLGGLERRDGERIGALCDLLLRVVEQDLKQDEQGRWRVARQVARNRLVSLTDAEAGHGHKSRSVSFWGYKINVLGDAVSGVVAAVSVTAGNGHDAGPGHALVKEAQRMRLEIGKVLADTAYGGIESRLRLKELGVDLVAPPPGSTRKGAKHSKHAFAIDFASQSATCPNGARSERMEWTKGKEPKPAYVWGREVCAACPLRAKCLRASTAKPDEKRTGRPPKGKRLVVPVHEHQEACRAEGDDRRPPVSAKAGSARTCRAATSSGLDRTVGQQMREARAAWADPKRREEYRDRSMGERLNVLLIQHGARRARARGLGGATLQVQLIGITSNLGVVARNVAEELAEQRDRRVPRAERMRRRRPRTEGSRGWREGTRQLTLA